MAGHLAFCPGQAAGKWQLMLLGTCTLLPHSISLSFLGSFWCCSLSELHQQTVWAEAWVLGEWGIHKRAREMGSLADAAEAPPASAPQEPSYPTPSSQKCRSRWRGCRYGAGVQECFSASQAEQHLCRRMARMHLCYPMQHCHRACVFPQHLNHLSYIL